MNLVALCEKSHTQKRRWRAATCEDGASPENRERGDGETSLPEAKEEPLVSYAQPATREPSPEHDESERTVERHTDPHRPTEKRTHPVARLPDPEEEIHTESKDTIHSPSAIDSSTDEIVSMRKWVTIRKRFKTERSQMDLQPPVDLGTRKT
ncbi:hypothetical protein E2C01_035482 [Portunus trituberculatus]|uniref:Uncharacterized protein n=1 Tax=Portunus trituberculatus TaxID=210409 RepID=A0A5B7F8G4_PORTR|nr:hypothetical protein [Portunus trituberculatus]